MAARMETGVMCIMEKSEFQRSSPDGWRDVGGKRSNVDDEFTVLVNDDDFQGTDTTFVVSFVSCLHFSCVGSFLIYTLIFLMKISNL